MNSRIIAIIYLASKLFCPSLFKRSNCNVASINFNVNYTTDERKIKEYQIVDLTPEEDRSRKHITNSYLRNASPF
jgi:hypothetical protein